MLAAPALLPDRNVEHTVNPRLEVDKQRLLRSRQLPMAADVKLVVA